MSASASPPNPIPPSTPTGPGAYLTFDIASEGTLFLHWSKTPVRDALAYIAPEKIPPPFKFTTNGGRSEHARGFRADGGKAKMLSGFCLFFKIASPLEMGGKCVLLTDSVKCYVRNFEGQVAELHADAIASLKDVSAIAFVSAASDAFEGVQSATQDYFLGIGKREGASLSLA